MRRKSKREPSQSGNPKRQASEVRSFSVQSDLTAALDILAENEACGNASLIINRLLREEWARKKHLYAPHPETLVQVEIIVGDRLLPVHHHVGQAYVEAKFGKSYAIRLRNTSSSRRLAVLTVDGVNALDASDGSFKGNGYVLEPYQIMDVPGWWRDGKECARFKFTSPGKSYVGWMQRDSSNVGVLGCAVFADKPRPIVGFSPPVFIEEPYPVPVPYLPSPWPYDRWPQSWPIWLGGNIGGLLNGEGQNVLSRDVSGDAGTGYGEKSAFVTVPTTFDREENPCEVVTIRYASAKVLKAWGVPLDRKPRAVPNAFPAEHGGVPAPPGWRG